MSLFLKAVKLLLIFFLLFNSFFIGKKEAFCLTLKEEEELAKQFARYIEYSNHMVYDPLIRAYVQKVGNKLVETIEEPPFTMSFNVLVDPVYNAFAGPGGHIYINSGLFLAMESEADLAGIMGHEIAHVSCRHISELVARSKRIGFGTLAGVAAGILAAVSGASPDAAAGLIMGSQAAGHSAMLSYTRDNEREADERGLVYLSRAGYGGEGLLRMLKVIRSREWYTTDDVPVYLRTHPGSEERISFISSWLESNARKKDLKLKDPSDNREFLYVKYRLLARYADIGPALSQLESLVSLNPDDISLKHALALVLLRKGEKEEALKIMEGLALLDPMNLLLMTDLGRVRYFAGKHKEAIFLLENIGVETDDPELLFDLGRAYAAVGDFKKAVPVFEKTLDLNPRFIGALYAAGKALGEMGDEARAHYYLGKYHEALNNFNNADFHYRRSLSLFPEDAPELKEVKEGLKRINEKKAGKSAAARKNIALSFQGSCLFI